MQKLLLKSTSIPVILIVISIQLSQFAFAQNMHFSQYTNTPIHQL